MPLANNHSLEHSFVSCVILQVGEMLLVTCRAMTTWSCWPHCRERSTPSSNSHRNSHSKRRNWKTKNSWYVNHLFNELMTPACKHMMCPLHSVWQNMLITIELGVLSSFPLTELTRVEPGTLPSCTSTRQIRTAVFDFVSFNRTNQSRTWYSAILPFL